MVWSLRAGLYSKQQHTLHTYPVQTNMRISCSHSTLRVQPFIDRDLWVERQGEGGTVFFVVADNLTN